MLRQLTCQQGQLAAASNLPARLPTCQRHSNLCRLSQQRSEDSLLSRNHVLMSTRLQAGSLLQTSCGKRQADDDSTSLELCCKLGHGGEVSDARQRLCKRQVRVADGDADDRVRNSDKADEGSVDGKPGHQLVRLHEQHQETRGRSTAPSSRLAAALVPSRRPGGTGGKRVIRRLDAR